MLKNINIEQVYDSSEYDIVQDLVVPLLKHSCLYFRGVGYFSSGWLQLASEGIMQLIKNGGVAKFIISPILDKNDWEAIKLGDKATEDEVLKAALIKNLEDLGRALITDTRNALAWMIADGILEFKFAVPRENWEEGDYHDKIGLCSDETGDMIVFHGSLNDSIKGSYNGEAFSVFKSWEEGQLPYVKKHKQRFLDLWNYGNKQFKIKLIPDAVKDKFIKLRSTTNRPYVLPALNIHSSIFDKKETPNIPFNLYEFQKEAVDAWILDNCCGLFEMATGTGKTYTALYAAVNRFEKLGSLFLVILVPYLHLLEQWENNCKKFGFSPILCSGEHGKWQIEVKTQIQDFNIGTLSNVCVLAVHNTAASERFQEALNRSLFEKTMLIGDEVHALGSRDLRKAMIPNASMRLGLSATPRRWFDEEGTNAIFEYFKKISYEYTLEQAIGKYLVPYEYFPILINLNLEETEEYERLTSVIAKLSNFDKNKHHLHERLSMLLIERSRILLSAEDKLSKLLTIIRNLKNDAENKGNRLKDVLIYCAPGMHTEVLKKVSQIGLNCHEFVHTVNMSRREDVLREFECGDIQVLVAIKCLDEGVDVPSTKIAFFMASTTNPKEFIQRRGRILRLSKGKQNAVIYDFIVIPREENFCEKREVDKGLLRREMPRFVEFSSAAMNEFTARSEIRDILNKYELLDLLDKKAWDIYAEFMTKKDFLINYA